MTNPKRGSHQVAASNSDSDSDSRDSQAPKRRKTDPVDTTTAAAASSPSASAASSDADGYWDRQLGEHLRETEDAAAAADRYWEDRLGEHLGKASRSQLVDLAQNLFRNLWKHAGRDPAREATQGFERTLSSQQRHNAAIAGDWIFEDGGSLAITKNLGVVTLLHKDLCEAEDLALASSPSANPLVFEGDTLAYKNSHNGFAVKLEIVYRRDADELDCELEVSPPREPQYGPSDAYGGSDSFVATRGVHEED